MSVKELNKPEPLKMCRNSTFLSELWNTKAISSITYNHLNLPSVITVTGKGTITYTYDAAGNKQKKTTQENNATVAFNGTNYTNVTITTTTTYIGGFIYESKTYSDAALSTLQYTDKLQFAGHEEGRIRALYDNTVSPNTITGFAYDYFVKDHLGNVRMVLTDEQKTIYYPAATLEGTYSAAGTAQANSMVNYEKQFYTIDYTKVTDEGSIPSWPTETVANTKLYYNHNGNPPSNLSYPAGCTPVQTDGSTKLYKLNATANKTGLEFIIKVMAGDKTDILGKSYYLNTTTVSNSNSTGLDLLGLMTDLLGAPGNAAAQKGYTATQLNTMNSSLVPSSFFRGNNNETGTTVPKAYINYIFFDEQFKYAGGNFSRVGSSGSVKDHWYLDAAQLQNITVPKNGYIFVYVSNESNFDVFFDNLQVIHKPGPLIEETHYYPFGLTMSGISSRALNFGSPENKYKFNKGSELQNKEFSDGSGLELYATNFRSLDPQLGRWWQIDPKPDYAQSLYSAMNNNPISINDPLGDTTIVDKRGYVINQYGKDNLIFLQKGKKLVGIGEFGKSIDGNKIFKNLLKAHIAEAKGMGTYNLNFYNKVKNKGEWDLKNNKNTIYGLAAKFDKDQSKLTGTEVKTEFQYEGTQMTAEELGNYHYGATGNAAGFSEFFLKYQAGQAQMKAGTSKPEWQPMKDYPGGHGGYRGLGPPYGDDPHDQEMIHQGFNHYNTNKEDLKKPEED